MAQLPFDQSVTRFKDNEERFDKFINDETGYTTSSGQQVDSVKTFLNQVLLDNNVYPSITAGRAAVSDGESFMVEGNGSTVAVYVYRRDSSTTQTLLADFPTATSTVGNYWDLQTRLARVKPANSYFTGEIFNGASFWDGTTTSGAGQASGGIFIPSGSSGNQSYNRYHYELTADERAKYAGRTIRLLVPLITSTNFSTSDWIIGEQKTNSATGGTLVSMGVEGYLRKIDDTHWVVIIDYEVQSGDTSLAPYLQNQSAVLNADLYWFCPGLSFMPLDVDGFEDAFDSLLGTLPDRVADLEQKTDYTSLVTATKFESSRSSNGEVFNGAVFWDGTQEAATSVAAGLKIPAGSTGLNSYIRWRWELSSEDQVKYAGRPIRLMVALDVSDNFFEEITGWALGADGSGTLGPMTEKEIVKIDANTYIYTMLYTPTGSEIYVNMYLQHNTSDTSASDATMHGRYYIIPLDAQNFEDVFDVYAEENLGDYLLPSYDDTSSVEASGQAFNGASISPANKTLDIPSDSTGANSYLLFALPLHADRSLAGQTVTLEVVLNTSEQFNSTVTLAANVNGYINGQLSLSRAVPGSVKILETTGFATITADYVVRGYATEYMGIYAQISGRNDGTPEVGYSLNRASYKIKNSSTNEEYLRRVQVANQVDSGELYPFLTTAGEALDGSVFIDDEFGISIPTGEKGLNAYVGYLLDATEIRKYKKAVIKFELYLRTSVDFTDETLLGYNITSNTGSGSAQRAYDKTLEVLNPQTLRVTMYYRIEGDENSLRPYVQVNSASVDRTSDGFMTYQGMRVVYESVGGDASQIESTAYSLPDMAIAVRDSLTSAGISGADVFEYTRTVTVKPDGTGDYTTLKLAIAAVGGGTTAKKRVLYKVYPGIYTDTNYYIPNFADVLGVGQRDEIWFKGYLAPSSALTTITNTQTFWMNQTSKISNIKVTAQNMRYPIHSDSGASGYEAYQEIDDCWVEHLGNDEAREWQANNGGNPSAVWGSEHTWGCGTHSRQIIISRRTTWKSATSPFYFHTNKDFAFPNYIELDDSQVICTSPTGNALVVQCLGSGTPDRFVVKNSRIDGNLRYNPSPILSAKAENYRGNFNTEVETFISGSSPVAWEAVYSGTANVLELRSVEASGSKVEVSGDAAEVLFGVTPDAIPGGVGFAGRIYSSHAITCVNGFQGISLANRLGDCSTTNLTLNILFDDSVSKVLTLNLDYSAMSNAAIISDLNTKLADAERSFYEINPYANVAPIYQLDREVSLKNTDSQVIIKGDIVAYDGSRRYARKALSTDPRENIVGVALETFAPDYFGRVQFSGQFRIGQLNFTGTPSFAFNDKFGVGSTAGQLVENPSVDFIRCVQVDSGINILEII
jgi:hypothetical protein